MIANPKTAHKSVAPAVPSREHSSVRSHEGAKNKRRRFPKVATVTVPEAAAGSVAVRVSIDPLVIVTV